MKKFVHQFTNGLVRRLHSVGIFDSCMAEYNVIKNVHTVVLILVGMNYFYLAETRVIIKI